MDVPPPVPDLTRLPTGIRQRQCPRCGHPHAHPVRFTWWGGLLGPRLLHQVRCAACHTPYNAKTARSSTPGILLYLTAIVVAIILLLAYAV